MRSVRCDGKATPLQFRRDVLKPFFDQYLKDGAKKADTPPVFIYNTGDNRWDRLTRWPLACETGCGTTSRALYLTSGSGPSFTAPVRISGAPIVHLVASTSGSDSDWVVKLVDVYPDEVASQPEMGGYQLPIAMDIFRGRYRESFATPKAIASDKPLTYTWGLPTANHVFQPGHRIMVQVQSSWFPLYDRNPQTFVPNIFFAKPADYVKATERVYHAPGAASFISLPVVPAR